MATIEEKQRLYDALKFTPRTYSISMWGYGGEIVMGRVERKIFDYFKHRRLDVSDYAWNYDYADEHNIPEEMRPFEPGSWYECDGMAHGSGVNLDAGTIQIEDEEGNVVLDRSLEDIDGTDIQLECDDEAWIGQADAGDVVFIGRSGEKGTFFEGEIPLTKPFDPEKLEIHYDEIDGESYVTCVYYDGEEIENNGANTNGKSSEFGFYLVKEDKSWESYQNMDSIQYQMTEWFPKKTKPVRNGIYTIKTADKNSYTYQALWTGKKWISSWTSESNYDDAEEIKIKEWQGIAHDPDATQLPVTKQKPVAKKQPAKVEFNADASWPF